MGVRNCFLRVNTDVAYRAKFIKDPVSVLKSEGVKLSAKDQKELVAVVKKLSKTLPNLGELPKGHKVILTEGGSLPSPDDVAMFI